MKISKILYLAILLIFVLAISLFAGSSTKEGIKFRDISTLKTLLNGIENDSEKIELFKRMNISDPEFRNIIYNDTLNDSEKVAKIKIMVAVLLMGGVEENDLENVINKDITLDNVTKNSHNIRL